MLHAAEPFLERNLHPTVIIRGYVRALEDAVKIVDELAFPIDINDRGQMLKIIASCIGTKFTSRFGSLMPVRAVLTPGMLQGMLEAHKHVKPIFIEWAICRNKRNVAFRCGEPEQSIANVAPLWVQCQGLRT